MKKSSILFCACLLGGLACAAAGVAEAPVKVYPHLMNPRLHPDDARRPVKPPDSGTLGNKLQFMAMRTMTQHGYTNDLDRYVSRDRLGDIVWAHYGMLYNKNVEEQVKELKRRNLFLFDIWGFVPGSGPGAWTQFKVPEGVLEMFERELGDKWLGMDNGEQDGRYICIYAEMTHPFGAGRFEQYLNFQRHFERMGDLLGNKMATLVSLNFGHYFMREGVYTLIGAETAQALPNAQVYYSFIRGAGKQHGVPWFGNVSVFNRWGWKGYPPDGKSNNPKVGPTKGASLALMKKLMYNQICYNSVAVGFENGFHQTAQKLSPIGRIQQAAAEWSERNGDPGVMHTPIALMVDVHAGWSFPRHLYTREVYRVWGALPYDAGDYLTDGVLDMFYPTYQDASYFHDERGFNTSTPFGDSADCILSDAPAWLLRQYPVLVLAGRIEAGEELRDTLRGYVRQGGHLVLTAANARALFPEGIAGVRTLAATRSVETTSGRATLHELELTGGAAWVAGKGVPADFAARGAMEGGAVTVIASPYGVAEEMRCALPVENKVDLPLAKPFPLLDGARAVLADIFRSQMLFATSSEPVDDGLSLITCRRGKGEYTLAVCNNTWEQKPFAIHSRVGRILAVEELATDVSEREAIGYTPEMVTNAVIGVDGKNTIAAGAVRLLRVRTDEGAAVKEIAFATPPANPKGRALVVRGNEQIKEAVLRRPTFFRHYDSVVVDWRYFHSRDAEALKREAGWIRNQGLRVVADMTSGLNLFPDIRLLDNDANETPRTRAIMDDVVRKMAALGAKDLIIARHRFAENNLSPTDAKRMMVNEIRRLCAEAAKVGVTVHLRQSPMRRMASAREMLDWVKLIGSPNLKCAPSLAGELLDYGGDMAKVLKDVEELPAGMWLLALPEKDPFGQINSLHRPLAEGKDLTQVIDALKKKGCMIVFDAIYPDFDAEYRDAKLVEK